MNIHVHSSLVKGLGILVVSWEDEPKVATWGETRFSCPLRPRLILPTMYFELRHAHVIDGLLRCVPSLNECWSEALHDKVALMT